MRKLTVLTLLTCVMLSGCGTGEKQSNHDIASKVNIPASTVTASQPVTPSVPKGDIMNSRSNYMSKEGLQIFTTPPTEGPAKVAWDYIRLLGEQKYDEALLLLDGSDTKDNMKIWAEFGSKLNDPYLIEVIGSSFVRWTDFTDIAFKETEDNGAIEYKIIYLEVNLKLRGKLTEEQNAFRNGLNRFAIHVVKYKENGPWRISLLGGAPPLEK
ncbi:hypothetical protein [Paenibacillus sp. SN-8-1]|uniref:hypothetical protein n=1 Tax=Paenibacillus sp. SN-8-1 TaxID=3435409 RepID=UPI003D9A66FD